MHVDLNLHCKTCTPTFADKCRKHVTQTYGKVERSENKSKSFSHIPKQINTFSKANSDNSSLKLKSFCVLVQLYSIKGIGKSCQTTALLGLGMLHIFGISISVKTLISMLFFKCLFGDL